MATSIAAVVTVLAVLALLVAERAGSRAGAGLSKSIASLGFVLAAWLAPVSPTLPGYALFVGLVLCAAGDVLLIPAGTGRAFQAGIACFAGGHLAYAVGFAARGLALPGLGLGLGGMALVGFATVRWLAPHLPADLRVPVRVYIAVIGVMVASALGSSAETGDVRVAAGALAFAASDLSVARDRFVRPSFVNLGWGLPLYYAAQLALAWASAG
jgi:uncharacterized membrane protein YhhN